MRLCRKSRARQNRGAWSMFAERGLARDWIANPVRSSPYPVHTKYIPSTYPVRSSQIQCRPSRRSSASRESSAAPVPIQYLDPVKSSPQPKDPVQKHTLQKRHPSTLQELCELICVSSRYRNHVTSWSKTCAQLPTTSPILVISV